MLVNKYVMENIRTGETVIGTRAELELQGFDGDWLSDASKRKFLINISLLNNHYGKNQGRLLNKPFL